MSELQGNELLAWAKTQIVVQLAFGVALVTLLTILVVVLCWRAFR